MAFRGDEPAFRSGMRGSEKPRKEEGEERPRPKSKLKGFTVDRGDNAHIVRERREPAGRDMNAGPAVWPEEKVNAFEHDNREGLHKHIDGLLDEMEGNHGVQKG